jgi:hypothetical protein
MHFSPDITPATNRHNNNKVNVTLLLLLLLLSLFIHKVVEGLSHAVMEELGVVELT